MTTQETEAVGRDTNKIEVVFIEGKNKYLGERVKGDKKPKNLTGLGLTPRKVSLQSNRVRLHEYKVCYILL